MAAKLFCGRTEKALDPISQSCTASQVVSRLPYSTDFYFHLSVVFHDKYQSYKYEKYMPGSECVSAGKTIQSTDLILPFNGGKN